MKPKECYWPHISKILFEHLVSKIKCFVKSLKYNVCFNLEQILIWTFQKLGIHMWQGLKLQRDRRVGEKSDTVQTRERHVYTPPPPHAL
jgi:hypothetical protein